RWGGWLDRHLRDRPAGERAALAAALNRLLGLDAEIQIRAGAPWSMPATAAAAIALYRTLPPSDRR
ncbi:MAG: hypothetical protein M3Z21_05105, partial [Pseudomonadota bacterium]|nr:hypothetical protein [Pseudomonadota bacterium]